MNYLLILIIIVLILYLPKLKESFGFWRRLRRYGRRYVNAHIQGTKDIYESSKKIGSTVAKSYTPYYKQSVRHGRRIGKKLHRYQMINPFYRYAYKRFY